MRSSKLEENLILALQGKLNESKLQESDATPEFLNDVKDLINKHLRVSEIETIELKDGKDIKDYLEGEEFIIITFKDGMVKQINVTGDSNLSLLRDILFELA